jgi:superfamily I DNA/RNA helicase
LGISHLTPTALRKATPYIGTLHSIAWHLIGRPEVVTATHLKQFARDVNSNADFRVLTRDVPPDLADGVAMAEASPMMTEVELMATLNSGMRHRLIDNFHALLPPQMPAGVSVERIHKLLREYAAWKESKGVMDFEDILEEGRLHTLPVRVLLLDEAQDCSPLLWSVIDGWAAHVHTLGAFGDVYQAIYSWAGASPVLFRDRPGQWLHIKEAHRFSNSHAEYAKEILRRGGWDSPRDREFHNAWQGVGDSASDGTTFYLARTHALLTPIRADLLATGVPFGELRGRAPLQMAVAQAYITGRKLVDQEKAVSGSALLAFADHLPAHSLPFGVKAAIKRLPDGALVSASEASGLLRGDVRALASRLPFAQYFDQVWANHGSSAFTDKPKISLSTIHGAKGREADVVHLVRSWGILPARNMRENPQEESTVAYVGASRHRKELILEEGDGIPYSFPPKETPNAR